LLTRLTYGALPGIVAAELQDRADLLKAYAFVHLEEEIRREALRPLGYEIDLPAIAASGAAARKLEAAADDDEGTPIRAVHFSNFIIQ
jgi:hypothetical protein